MPPEVDSVRQISVKAAMTDTLFPSTPKTKFKLSWKRLLHLAMLFVLVFGSVGKRPTLKPPKLFRRLRKYLWILSGRTKLQRDCEKECSSNWEKAGELKWSTHRVRPMRSFGGVKAFGSLAMSPV